MISFPLWSFPWLLKKRSTCSLSSHIISFHSHLQYFSSLSSSHTYLFHLFWINVYTVVLWHWSLSYDKYDPGPQNQPWVTWVLEAIANNTLFGSNQYFFMPKSSCISAKYCHIITNYASTESLWIHAFKWFRWGQISVSNNWPLWLVLWPGSQILIYTHTHTHTHTNNS